MNELKEKINIEKMIYEIRGKQVMLDSDLAKLYGTQTKRINEAVKNNPEKFPKRFSFKLNDIESEKFLVEIFDQKNETRGGKYKNPRVFTEQGVAMLATILKTKVAVEVSIAIMDAFVMMRKYISNNLIEQKYINRMVIEDNNRINLLEKSFLKLEKYEKSNHIFFEGQIYDAYSLLVDILKEAEDEIIIIDNYIDKQILDITCLIDRKVTIVTNKYNNVDIEKYKKQYNNLNIVISNSFHDRFIILDKKILYHCGASFKDLGTKCFAITTIEDIEYLNRILGEISHE